MRSWSVFGRLRLRALAPRRLPGVKKKFPAHQTLSNRYFVQKRLVNYCKGKKYGFFYLFYFFILYLSALSRYNFLCGTIMKICTYRSYCIASAEGALISPLSRRFCRGCRIRHGLFLLFPIFLPSSHASPGCLQWGGWAWSRPS